MNKPIIITLNLPEDTILLNEGVLDALDRPRQVQILVNKEEKKMLLRACTVDDREAVVVPEERTLQFEISCRSFLRRVRQLVKWEDNRPRFCYSVADTGVPRGRGLFLPSLNVACRSPGTVCRGRVGIGGLSGGFSTGAGRRSKYGRGTEQRSICCRSTPIDSNSF